MKSQDLVSVIIPTYNSANNLQILLDGFVDSEDKNFEIIINDDKRTNDGTLAIIEKYRILLPIIYVQENIKMAQARKKAAKYASGNIFFHMDSDMKVTEGLIGEIVEKMQRYDALIIDEESYGETFRARCKWLEKKCYKGVRQIESLRVVKRDIYEKLGGHDEQMVFSEDKDFDLRVQEQGYNIGRVINNYLWHNEGDLELRKTLKKKKSYSRSANLFAQKHPEAYKWQTNILNRYWIYLKNIQYCFVHPLLYFGMIRMKTCEFMAGAFGILFSR